MEMLVRDLGLQDYLPTYEAMKSFTANRTEETPDEIWVLQHPPTYTLGQAGNPEHLLKPTQIYLWCQSIEAGKLHITDLGRLLFICS